MATRGYVLWAACLFACSRSDSGPGAATAAASAPTQSALEPLLSETAAPSAPADQPAEAEVEREHATGQHVLDDRSDLYASPDVKTRLAFVQDATSSMRKLSSATDSKGQMSFKDIVTASAQGSGKSADEIVAEIGFIETPFDSVSGKMWGRRLLQVFMAVAPVLDDDDWSADDFQLVESFAEYVSLHPVGPKLTLTGTDRRHDSEDITAFSSWLQEQRCEPDFRGGLILGIFIFGPLSVKLVDEPIALPSTSTAAVGDGVQLRTVVALRPDKRVLIQAVDGSERVLWTCDMGPGEFAQFFGDAERDEPCGWRIALSERPGGNGVILFLDVDRRPSFKMLHAR